MPAITSIQSHFQKLVSFVIIIFLLLCNPSVVSAQKFSDKKLLLKAANYNLDIHLDYTNNKLKATCILTVKNPSSISFQTIPLLLYRLMKVTAIKNVKGRPIEYTQKNMQFEDWKVYQSNYIEVTPDKPLLKNDSCKLIIEYEGYLLGYTETGNLYVRDNINTAFTILRPDCLAFPELGYPNQKVNRAAGFSPSYNYEITVHVPDSLVVVNGGTLMNKHSKNGFTAYTYRNSKLAWRIDVAIGKYKIIETPLLKVYYLEKDSGGARTVLRYAQQTMNLYSKWWGELREGKIFSIIEIPNGYGSQADESCILQTADVFNDTTQMRQLYHEISHLWNVKSTDKYFSRWNEGLATFIEYLTIEKLENRSYLDYVTDWYLNVVKKDIAANSLLRKTPFIDFAKKEIQSYSYETGMILFRVLYEVMGEIDFNKCIARYYADYYSTGATTDQFVQTASKISGEKISDFFYDWMYTTRYQQLIDNGISIKEMGKKYLVE